MAADFPNFLKVSIAENNKPELPLLVDMFQQVLNFSYEPIWYDLDGIGKKLTNGTWTGMFGSIQRGECDIATHLLVKEERADIMDFTFPYMLNDVSFITNNPTKSIRTFAFIDAFSFQLWIAVLVFYIVFSLIGFRFLQSKGSYLDMLMKLLGSLLGQSFSFKFGKTSKRFLFISWIIGVFLLTNSLRNTLLSFWSVPTLNGIRSIQDLADAVRKGTCIVKTRKNHIYIDMLLNSPDENVRIIGQSMLQNNDLDLGLEELLEKHRAAFVTGRQTLIAYAHEFYLPDESFFFYLTSFGIRKGFCCMPALNKVIVRMFETGLLDEMFWHDPEIKWDKNHKVSSSENQEVSPLHLQDIIGAFYFLLIGYALSLATFIAELFTFMKNKQ